jgi:hypothetical protein
VDNGRGTATRQFVVDNGAPTIETMTPSIAPPNSAVPVQITGTNLNGATVTVSGTQVDISGVTTTSTTIDFTLRIFGGAAIGPRTLTVDNGRGTATRQFVVDNTVVIAFFNPPADIGQRGGENVVIHGTGIRDPSLGPPFPRPAPDTEIHLEALGVGQNVASATIQVLADTGGNQRVQFQMPTRNPTWSRTQEVVLEFWREGEILIEVPYQYADPF